MEKLDQLHVVSDLHFGGEPGHQIFDQGELLAALVDHLRARDPKAQIGLVLCGDIVDFLASKDARYLDPEGAAHKLGEIITDPAFAPVFAALARFVRTPNRTLVLVLGNHDVELALPEVQDSLLAAICGDDAAAHGRVRVAMDGTGYACSVGGRRALCVHGNEVDPWNIVPPEALRSMIYAEKQGAKLPAWQPNAGTRLVIDIMNGIKKRFPLVDLLKPESVPVVGIISALDPSQLGALKRLPGVATRRSVDGVRMATGFLSADEGSRSGRTAPTGDWLGEAKDAFTSNMEAQPELSAEDEYLSWAGVAADRLRGRSPVENLRVALGKWLKGDTTFAIETEDETFRGLDQRIDPNVYYLIAGHTHLARALGRKRGDGFYFNSGTWIRLIRLTDEMLESNAAFSRAYAAFENGSLEALDAEEGLILHEPTVVSIEAGKENVEAALRRAERGPDGRVQLALVEGSLFTSPRVNR